MDSNLRKILDILIENGPTTTDEIAYLENVSTRTVDTRINTLSDLLKGIARIIKRDRAYSLIVDDYDRFMEASETDNNLDDPQVEKASILNILLSSNEYFTLDYLSSKLNVDKRSISNTLKEINNYLEYFHAEIKRKTSKGIKIEFKDNATIPLLVRQVCSDLEKYSLCESRLDEYKDLVSKYIQDKSLVDKIGINLLVIDRIRNMNMEITSSIKDFYPLWDESNTHISNLKLHICQVFPDITDNELEFILSPLNLKSNEYLDKNKIQIAFESNRDLIYSCLKNDVKNFNLDTDTVYYKIRWHVLFLINRSLLHIKLKDHLPQSITEMYPLAFEFALNLSEIIEKRFSVKVWKNEIGYLVLYFEQVIESLNKGSKKVVGTIALVSNTRMSVTEYIIKRINQSLPSTRLEVFDNQNDLIKENKDYLFVMSDEPINYKDVPVVSTNILFRNNALEIISLICSIFKFIKQGKAKVIRLDLKSNEYKSVIKEMVTDLVKLKELTPDYYDRWLVREKKSNNIINNGVMIPHATDSSGKSRILLSFGIVKNKVEFSKSPIKLVALLGIPENLNDSLVEVISEIYDLITLIPQNEVLLENALFYDNEEPFTQMLEGV